MEAGQTTHFRVVIAGGGFSGLGQAIRLKQEGIEDFLILERAEDVGGVWRDNTYPGCACDVQSHLYSFSFAPNPGWSRAFSPQGEIHAYLRHCADRYQLGPHCRFGHAVRDARWDEERQRWTIETTKGTFTADAFVAAVGALSDPSIPKLTGLETFQGKVMHSAQWDHAYELAGKRVAVIGTGASAIQFVPAIQPKVGKLVLFQRTAPWILPRRDRAIPEGKRKLYRSAPGAQWLVRSGIYALRELLALGFFNPALLRTAQKVAVRYLARNVADPVLRAKLTPNYTMGCKRILISDDYLPSLTRENVEVVTDGVREIRAHSVVTTDGTEHEVDAIIFGTGFHVTDLPIARYVRGRDGRSLHENWGGSPKAHLGTTVAGYPNFFMLQGPNTGLGHTSVITMIESQIEHVIKAIKFLDRKALAAIEPAEEAQARFVSNVDARMTRTVWMQGGCSSWYLDATGRNSTLWPGFTFTFKRRVERFDPKEYVAIPRRLAAVTGAPLADQATSGQEVREARVASVAGERARV